MPDLFPPPLLIISASRRTDLARCFPGVLAGWLKAGQVQVPNPFNRQKRIVDLRPEKVHTFLLWSKDYSRVLANESGVRDSLQTYAQVYFHLTITGLGGTRLEPGVAQATDVARQFEALVKWAGHPLRVNWRFDPVVIWRDETHLKTNLRAFGDLAARAAGAGLQEVTVSLCQDYAKLQRRFQKAGISMVHPRIDRVKAITSYIVVQAARHGLKVKACCCPALLSLAPVRCVDGGLLSRLHPQGGVAATGKDTGQRPDCACTPSVDIGDYSLSCPEGCLYCYANPK